MKLSSEFAHYLFVSQKISLFVNHEALMQKLLGFSQIRTMTNIFQKGNKCHHIF
jgi:hypothetical protein